MTSTTAIRTCAHCGTILPEGNPFNLSPMELRIYNFIASHPQCTEDAIFKFLYADRTQGIPSSNIVGVSIRRTRAKLDGVRLICSRGGPTSTYRLVKDS